MTALRAGLRASSGGKGVTELEAKVGALCEAVERYCGTLDGDELRIWDSYRGLGDQAVHPNACQLFDERQFAERDAVERRLPALPPHPRAVRRARGDRLDAGVVAAYRQAAAAADGDAVLQARHPEPCPRRCEPTRTATRPAAALRTRSCKGSSSWSNATRWRCGGTTAPGSAEVSLDSFGDPWASRLPDAVRPGSGGEVWVLDVTSDLGIPVMAAVSRRTDKPSEDIMLGFGAHVDPHIAMRRALTELGQLLPAVVQARADGSGYRRGGAPPDVLVEARDRRESALSAARSRAGPADRGQLPLYSRWEIGYLQGYARSRATPAWTC